MTNFRNITLLLALFLCTVASATAANQDVLNLTSLRSFRGDGHGGEGFTIPPVLRNEKPATLIIVHGLGGTGEEWGIISLALSFFSLNYVKFVIPTAPIAYVTYLKRNLTSWFDITSFEQGSTTGFEQRSVEQLSKAVQINPNQFEVSVQRMNRIIQREIANGVEPERIFLTGFSQGGAIALHTFLRSKWSLAGVIGAATWIPFIETYPAAMSRQTSNKKILLLHGESDIRVPFGFAKRLANHLDSFRQNINFTSFPGEPHLILNDRLAIALEQFVIQTAPGTTRYLNTLINDLSIKFGSLTTQLETVPSA